MRIHKAMQNPMLAVVFGILIPIVLGGCATPAPPAERRAIAKKAAEARWGQASWTRI